MAAEMIAQQAMGAAAGNSGGGGIDIGGIIKSGIGVVGGIGMTALANYYNQKAAAKDRQFAQDMYQQQLNDARFDAQTQWQRSTDYAYLMNQWKKAGINPYAVLGNTTQAPVSRGANMMEVRRPQFDSTGLGGIQNILQNLPQLSLIQAQVKRTEAETNSIEQSTIYQKIVNKYQDKLSQQNLAIAAETEQNLINTGFRIKAEGSKADAEARYLEYRNQFKELLLRLETTMDQAEINRINAQLPLLAAQVKALNASTDLNIQEKTYNDATMHDRSIGIRLDNKLKRQEYKQNKEMLPYNKWESGTRSFRNVGGTVIDGINAFKRPKNFHEESDEEYVPLGEGWMKNRTKTRWYKK